METVWGKVTWYSKIIAMIVFCALPFLGFYLGIKYGEVQNELPKLELQAEQNQSNSSRYNEAPLQSVGSPADNGTSTLLDTSSWKTYVNKEYGFQISYPQNLVVYEEGQAKLPSNHLFQLSIETDEDEDDYLDYFDIGVLRLTVPLRQYLQDIGRESELQCKKEIQGNTINKIEGLELFGCSGEGHGYEDTFYFEKNGYIYALSLDPGFSGRVENKDREVFDLYDLDKVIYEKILNSLRLAG